MTATLRDAEPLKRVLGLIEELGLRTNLLELETDGYTVVPGVLTEDQMRRARAAILARVERATGRAIDPDAASAEDFNGMQYIAYLLYDDPVFEEILAAQKPLALITYLLGESCLLSSMGCHFRGPGGMPLMLHSDNGNGMPPPFSPTSMVANVNYALTPYSREAGALVMVPGSHRLQRPPTAHENFRPANMSGADVAGRVTGGEGVDDVQWRDPPGIETMDIAPGDAVIWHGNTWHGSHRRDLPGVRMNLAAYFNRQFVRTQEDHRGPATQALVKRNGNDQRIAVLLGAKQPYGWREDGPDYALMARNPRGLHD